MRRLLVLSDLHIAPDGELSNFREGRALEEFLRSSARPETVLCLNGDTFDFLQVPGRPGTLVPSDVPSLVGRFLTGIDGAPSTAGLAPAFSRFVRDGGEVVLIPGNHDPEIGHPEVSELLRRWCGLSKDDPRLTVRIDSEPWRMSIGGREVVVAHGHRADPWNEIPPSAIVDAISAGKDSIAWPTGSLLVLRVFHELKGVTTGAGVRRFKFLDRLKPEMPGVLLLLLYLAPQRVLAILPAFGASFVQGLSRWLRVFLRNGPTLAVPSPSEETRDSSYETARAIFDALSDRDRQAGQRTVHAVDEFLAGLDSVDPLPGRLAAHGGGRFFLRAALERLSYDRTFFERSAVGPDDRRIIDEYLGGGVSERIVIAGHTHAARDITLGDGRRYFNTGTWTDLLALPDPGDDDLEGWIDRLERDELPRRVIRTYAEIDEQSADLRIFETTE